jgi:hypothetical protein
MLKKKTKNIFLGIVIIIVNLQLSLFGLMVSVLFEDLTDNSTVHCNFPFFINISPNLSTQLIGDCNHREREFMMNRGSNKNPTYSNRS